MNDAEHLAMHQNYLEMRERQENSDPINPSYYTDTKFSAVDVIEEWDLGFHLGNVIKYISRAGKKHDNVKEDLQKAQWYLARKIEKL